MSDERSNLMIPYKLRQLAKERGINMSLVARLAILAEIEDYDFAKARRKKDKSYTATLLPFGDNEILQNTGEEK
jgi:post-segregation antitoxin (ccd killing protein)